MLSVSFAIAARCSVLFRKPVAARHARKDVQVTYATHNNVYARRRYTVYAHGRYTETETQSVTSSPSHRYRNTYNTE